MQELATLSISDLRSLARQHTVSLAGCIEKSDILSALRAAGIDGAAAKKACEDLLPGWSPVVDDESGQTFYWNKETDETTWEVPLRREETKKVKKVKPKKPEGAGDWTTVLDDSGEYFYWNERTGDTSWDEPAEVAELLGMEAELERLRRDSMPPEGSDYGLVEGAAVRLSGLESRAGRALNGRLGRLLFWKPEISRWRVDLAGGLIRNVNADNLELEHGEDSDLLPDLVVRRTPSDSEPSNDSDGAYSCSNASDDSGSDGKASADSVAWTAPPQKAPTEGAKPKLPAPPAPQRPPPRSASTPPVSLGGRGAKPKSLKKPKPALISFTDSCGKPKSLEKQEPPPLSAATVCHDKPKPPVSPAGTGIGRGMGDLQSSLISDHSAATPELDGSPAGMGGAFGSISNIMNGLDDLQNTLEIRKERKLADAVYERVVSTASADEQATLRIPDVALGQPTQSAPSTRPTDLFSEDGTPASACSPGSLPVFRPPKAKHIIFEGVQGLTASRINGLYRPSGETINGCTAYVKHDDLDTWLCFCKGDWMVQAAWDKGSDTCLACSASSQFKAEPELVDAWAVASNNIWETQDIRVTMKFIEDKGQQSRQASVVHSVVTSPHLTDCSPALSSPSMPQAAKARLQGLLDSLECQVAEATASLEGPLGTPLAGAALERPLGTLGTPLAEAELEQVLQVARQVSPPSPSPFAAVHALLSTLDPTKGLAGFLRKNNCEMYEDLLVKADVDLETLKHMSEERLELVGIPMGGRLKITAALRSLDAEAEAPDEQQAQPEKSDATPGATPTTPSLEAQPEKSDATPSDDARPKPSFEAID